MPFIWPEVQDLTKEQFSFKTFFTMQLGYRHCLATIAFILDNFCDD